MIHEGERDREQKLKLINELKELEIQDDIRQAKRRITLFLCKQCGLRISFELKEDHNSAYMSYDYDDFKMFTGYSLHGTFVKFTYFGLVLSKYFMVFT
jgi:hypothetical protein